MNCLIELHPKAEEELTEVFQWYEAKSVGLGVRFIDAVHNRLTEISRYPERYTRKKGEFREAPTRIFPYIIIYEFLRKEKIIFVSYIFHVKRNPKLKYQRKR